MLNFAAASSFSPFRFAVGSVWRGRCRWWAQGLVLVVFGLLPAQAAIYNYAANDGSDRAFRLYVADDLEQVRGLLIWGNGAGQDVRYRADDLESRQIADDLGFALLACSQWGAFRDPAELPLFEQGIASLAFASGHPEMVDAIWLPLGLSNGGQMSYGLNALKPERVIAFATHKGGVYNNSRPGASALATPGLLLAGEADTQSRRDAIADLFTGNRPRGGRWVWVEEEGAEHQVKDGLDLILPFLTDMAAARYPETLTTDSGVPTLLSVPEAAGWLVGPNSFQTGLAVVRERAAFFGNPFTQGWVPNRRLAFLFRAFASYDKASADARLDPQSSSVAFGADLFYQILSPSAGWTRIEYYEGDTLLREVVPGDADPYQVNFAAEREGFVVAHALVTFSDGRQRTTMPRRRWVRRAPPYVPEVPVIRPSLGPGTVTYGEAFALEVEFDGDASPFDLQWYRDGEPIAGATAARYAAAVALSSHAGEYQVRLSREGEEVASTSRHSLVVERPDDEPAALLNLSVRGLSESAANPLTAGVVLNGTGTRPLLVRAVGPGLAAFNLPDRLADPRLAWLRVDGNTGELLASNREWDEAPETGGAVRDAAARVGAFPLSDGSADAALLIETAAGQFTAQAAAETDGEPGFALLEIYDAEAAGESGSGEGLPELVNLSSRAQTGPGYASLIGGFVIGPGEPLVLLVRAVGPGLATLDVAGAMADPQLTLVRRVNGSDVIVATNDSWSDQADTVRLAQEEVGAFELPEDSADAVLVVRLEPGAYTALVQPADEAGANGVALLELYVLP